MRTNLARAALAAIFLMFAVVLTASMVKHGV